MMKYIQQILPQLQSRIEGHTVSILSENYPDKEFTQTNSISMVEPDADVQLDLDYYSGKRKKRANALTKEKALIKQNKQIESGEVFEYLMTADVMEQIKERLATPGSLGKISV